MLFNWFPVNKPHRINNTNTVKHGKINNKMICWQSKNKWMNPKKKKNTPMVSINPQENSLLELKLYNWNKALFLIKISSRSHSCDPTLLQSVLDSSNMDLRLWLQRPP